MKQSRAILLVLVVLTALLGACSGGGAASGSSTPSMTPTPAPDYSTVDFSGTWTVAALYDSSGVAVDQAKLAEAGANFSLEFLSGGDYFLYDADGKVIGQGKYSVNLDQMTLTAAGQQTLYLIVDADTLRCTAQDGCVTVMKRSADEEEDLGDEDVIDEDIGDEDVGGEPEVSTEESASEEPVVSEETSAEVSAPAETTQG
jgi:hypothetical protein